MFNRVLSFIQSKRAQSLFPFLLVFYEVANYLANDMYLPALPEIATDLHTTVHIVQQTLTVFFLGTASLQLFLGPLSDRIGRRPVLFAGGFIFILSTWVCMSAANINILLIARVFQGCAICSVVTAGYSSIHELYDHLKAIKILAIMASITLLAPAFGPLLGSLVLQWLSWRWIFGILLIWAVFALLALWFLMPESNPKEQRCAFSWENLVKNYLAVISNTIFMRNTLIWCFIFLGIIAWIPVGPFLVMSKFHFSQLDFGIFQAIIFGGLILGAQMVNRIVSYVGAECLVSWGLFIALLASVSAFCLALFFPHFLFGLIICLTIYAFGFALTGPLNRLAIEACITAPMGTRMAVFSTFMSLFGFFGGLLAGFTYTGTLLWFGILLLVATSIACLIRGYTHFSKRENT